MFSWSGEKETSVSEVKVDMDSASETPDTVHICTESSGERHSLETIKPADSTAAVGDSSLGTDLQSLPKDTVSGSPHSISQLEVNEVDAPSVREERPASEPSSSSLPHQAPVPQSQEDTVPPVAPSSTTSIFTFNFPMLAKSRPPPETAVTPPPPDPSTERSSEPSIATQGTDIPVIFLQILDFITVRCTDPGNVALVNVAEPTRVASDSIHVSECDTRSLRQPTTATEVRTNTWWTYLGLNGSSSDVRAENRAQSQSVVTDVSSPTPDQPPTSDPPDSTQPECEIKPQMDLSSDVSAMERSPPNDKKPPVHNADAARQGSTWYTPWSWSQSPLSVATTVDPDMNSGSPQDSPEHSEMGRTTYEEQHTGDHEAGSAPDQVSASPQDPSTTRYVDYNNPIQSVISANPTGWMSFFTAKAIAMKSITYEKEDAKMEVMEIDDEMTPEPNSASSAPPAAIHPPPAQVVKPPVRVQPHPSDTLPAPSPPPKKLDDKRSPITHAVTYPETVVNDTLKRQPSPSPSKKSSVKTPTSPPPPNLVLPTWHDTFHTLPRSVVPREPPSALSKTLQYVSGVLFSRNETPSSNGKGKAKEIVYSPYDKALPRTWDALGGGETVDVLRGCKRVVIIGVHGWFPGASPPCMCNEGTLTTESPEGAVLRTLAGEVSAPQYVPCRYLIKFVPQPTGTSSKFVNGIADALDLFLEEHKVRLDKVTKIPLEGEGTINRRVERYVVICVGVRLVAMMSRPKQIVPKLDRE